LSKRDYQELKYLFAKLLKQISILPFIIGILFNSDGVLILLNTEDYESGELLIKNIEAIQTSSGVVNPSYSISGIVLETGHTRGLTLSNSEVKSKNIVYKFQSGDSLLYPLWYNTTGSSISLHRYKDEDPCCFPVGRIIRNLSLYILLLNGPIFFFWWLSKRLKKKYNIN
jgi:hypothetical protein